MIVVIHHCIMYYNFNTSSLNFGEYLFNGHAAVVLFYVLSGFVLSASISTKPLTKINIKHFLIKRVFRIYPALWASMVVAFSYVILFHKVPFLTDHINPY